MTENGEAFTPKEELQIKVELLARDLWSCARQLVSLRADPDAREFFTLRTESDIWSAKSNVDVLLSELRATDQRAA